MLLSEVKNELLSLGFEEVGLLSGADYQAYFRDGINKALKFISVEFPVVGRYDVTVTGSDEIEEFDLADNTDFASLIEAKIKKEVEGVIRLMPFSDFQLVQDSIVYVSAGVEGDITFYYRTRPTLITTATPDNTVMTINYKAERLLPLLAAYYIYADDDKEKAAMWKNEYEDQKNIILARTPRFKTLTFTGGI